jgi:hypothetical protein
VSLSVKDRIIDLGMGIISHGKENGGSDINGMPPKFRKKLALKLDAFDPFGIGRNFDGRDHLVHAQFDGVTFGGIHVNLLHFTVNISRRPVEPLTFPLIHMSPDHMTVGPFKFCVDVQQSLNRIITGRNLFQTLQRETQTLFIDDNRFSWLKVMNIQPKERNTVSP